MWVDNKTLIEGASGPLTFRNGAKILSFGMWYGQGGSLAKPAARLGASAAKAAEFAAKSMSCALCQMRDAMAGYAPRAELDGLKRIQAEIRLMFVQKDRTDHQQEQRRKFRSFVDQKMGDSRRKAKWRR